MPIMVAGMKAPCIVPIDTDTGRVGPPVTMILHALECRIF